MKKGESDEVIIVDMTEDLWLSVKRDIVTFGGFALCAGLAAHAGWFLSIILGIMFISFLFAMGSRAGNIVLKFNTYEAAIEHLTNKNDYLTKKRTDHAKEV